MSTTKKTAGLTSLAGLNFIPKKGEATTTVPEPSKPEAVEDDQEEKEIVQVVSGKVYTLSVRVEEPLYDRLGLAKLKTRKSGQDIFIEALQLWLKKNKF